MYQEDARALALVILGLAVFAGLLAGSIALAAAWYPAAGAHDTIRASLLLAATCLVIAGWLFLRAPRLRHAPW